MSHSPQSYNSPHFVITHEGELHGEDTLENRALVRRIHACVNACDGIATEELESGIVQDMRQVIAQVAPLLQQKIQQAGQPLTVSIPAAPAMPGVVEKENR